MTWLMMMGAIPFFQQHSFGEINLPAKERGIVPSSSASSYSEAEEEAAEIVVYQEGGWMGNTKREEARQGGRHCQRMDKLEVAEEEARGISGGFRSLALLSARGAGCADSAVLGVYFQ